MISIINLKYNHSNFHHSTLNMPDLFPTFTTPFFNLIERLGIPVQSLSPTVRNLLAGVALAALLRYTFLAKPKKAPRYVSNLDNVGAKVGQDSIPSKRYDVIVVGGGTSGCALAARLSEDPNIRVLLLEAGGSGSALPASVTPAGFGPKMLGGCSSINAQMAQYGAFGDFDQWAEHTGDESWAWKNFGKYFRKFESYQPHPDYPGIDESARGRNGPVKVGFYNTITDKSRAFIQAAKGVGIPETKDFNGPNGTNGVARRVSSETAYLTPEVLARPNLTVAINATATRVIFDTSGSKPRATAVEFGRVAGGPRWVAHAKEIVLSGGAVHSPHLLMVSGVGPSAHLKSHNIPIVKDIPGVGQKLYDHPVIDVYLKDASSTSSKFMKPQSPSDVVKLIGAIWQYKQATKKGWQGGRDEAGPLGMNVRTLKHTQCGTPVLIFLLSIQFGEAAAFVRSDDPVLFPGAPVLPDSTSAKDSPDLEIFSTPFAYKEHGKVVFNEHTFALHVYLLRPSSYGAVLLRSSDPWVQPSVNPNYLKEPEDIKKLARGVKLCLRIAQEQPLAKYLAHDDKRELYDHGKYHYVNDDEALEKLVTERVETVYHPTTTCRMGKSIEDGDVVDSKLRVFGIDGLRVCDASVFPWIVSGHTAGACFATAEKLADEIKAEFRAT
ncbi:hypothetical protein CVT24_000746 [Panaeolus cyanescens]|uniref:Amine oxidase n=1 Tax=Panaeolus cyanescens TaxID=181874 RepID=A0A409YCQ2_9AGAR|nr:hypothetical protein CVT24_000746 [Panaeolus cyanescens]